MRKLLSTLALCGTLLSCPLKEANAELDICLFPNQPIERTIMVDHDIYKTEIKTPQSSESDLLTNPIKDIPYFSLGGNIPLLSFGIASDNLLSGIPKTTERKNSPSKKDLSNKVISATFSAGGEIITSKNNNVDYSIKFELFLNSPMVDDCLSEGNKLYLVGGFTGKGSNPNKFAEKNLSQIVESFIEKYSFSADIYIVPKSPWSNQYLILRAGIDNLFGNTPEKPNINLSTTIEFPSILSWNKTFENFKISPYLSLYTKIPTDPTKLTTGSGQLGIKISGESEKALFLYTQADYIENKPLTFSTGLKINL